MLIDCGIRRIGVSVLVAVVARVAVTTMSLVTTCACAGALHARAMIEAHAEALIVVIFLEYTLLIKTPFAYVSGPKLRSRRSSWDYLARGV